MERKHKPSTSIFSTFSLKLFAWIASWVESGQHVMFEGCCVEQRCGNQQISLICMHLLAIYKERLYDLYVKNLNTVQIYDTMYVHAYRYRYNVYIYIELGHSQCIVYLVKEWLDVMSDPEDSLDKSPQVLLVCVFDPSGKSSVISPGPGESLKKQKPKKRYIQIRVVFV